MKEETALSIALVVAVLSFAWWVIGPDARLYDEALREVRYTFVAPQYVRECVLNGGTFTAKPSGDSYNVYSAVCDYPAKRHYIQGL